MTVSLARSFAETPSRAQPVKMLDRLRKLKGQVEKAGDLITFSEDDLGI